MSQNIQIEYMYNEEENDIINNTEKINQQKKQNWIPNEGERNFLIKENLIEVKKYDGVHQEPPKQVESNLGDSGDLQVYPNILSYVKGNKNNGSYRNNENMRNDYQDNNNNEPKGEKENSVEDQNNRDVKFKENNSYIDNMRNPYQDNNNDEPNDEKDYSQCQEVEKVVFNSQFSIQSDEDELTINQENIDNLIYQPNNVNAEDNNNELNNNSSSIIKPDSNNYFRVSKNNNNNYNLNEIKKNDNNENNNNNNGNKYKNYNLPSSINANNFNSSINDGLLLDNPYKKDCNQKNEIDNRINNNNDNNNNPSNFIQDNVLLKSNSMTSQNKVTEQQIIQSQPILNYDFPNNNQIINNGSVAPSNLGANKKIISQSEKALIKFYNNIIPSNQKVSKHLLDRYNKVSKTGLIELAESSYINAVLQSLGQIRYFASYFLNPKNQKFIETKIAFMPLTYATQRLFKHLYPYPEKNAIEIYSPKLYLEILSRLKTPYGEKRNNPSDLLIYILNTLHDELNLKKNNDNIIRMPYNYYFSADNVIQNGISNFTNNNKSKISDVVSWFQLVESKCTYCGISTFSFNSFNTYDLDIKRAYAYYLNNGKNYINIYNCLSYGEMTKQCKSYCYNCKSRAINNKQSRIYSPPNVFIFLLDRGNDFNQNYNHIPFIVDGKIDLSNFIIRQNTPMQYRLTGIVSFNLKEKKYVSYCESPIDSNWYWYNDEKVNLVFCKDILNNINDKDIPCILYYKSI